MPARSDPTAGFFVSAGLTPVPHALQEADGRFAAGIGREAKDPLKWLLSFEFPDSQKDLIAPCDLGGQDFRARLSPPHRYQPQAPEKCPRFFYDPGRLAQELEAQVAGGYGTVIAEPGLVVVPKVTRAVILRAVEELVQEGYFEHLRPLNGR